MKVYKFKINGNDYSVTINSLEDTQAEVTVNDVPYTVELEGTAQVKAPKATPATPAVVPTDAHPAVARTASPGASTSNSVKSPLPGVILNMMVESGQSVKVGQRLLVLEAMNMENNIDSDRDGVVKTINVRKGDSVLEGDVLLTIE